MHAKEIKTLKRETEEKIIKLLNRFQEKTLMRINSIDYNIIERPTLYDTPKYVVESFTLKLVI